MVRQWGGEPLDLGSRATGRTAWPRRASSLRGVDLAVTLGGASVGERDLVRGVLGEHGLALDFWQIAMRPGKPLMFGRVHEVPLLGLPGNPVSAGRVRRAVRARRACALLGLDPAPPEVPAVLGAPLGANDRRQEYLRASVVWRDDGRLEAMPAARQDSSMLATFARADCLIKRAPFAPAMPAGLRSAGHARPGRIRLLFARGKSCFSTVHNAWNGRPIRYSI